MYICSSKNMCIICIYLAVYNTYIRYKHVGRTTKAEYEQYICLLTHLWVSSNFIFVLLFAISILLCLEYIFAIRKHQ